MKDRLSPAKSFILAGTLAGAALIETACNTGNLDPLPEIDSACKANPNATEVTREYSLTTGTKVDLNVEGALGRSAYIEIVAPGEFEILEDADVSTTIIPDGVAFSASANSLSNEKVYVIKAEPSDKLTTLTISANCKNPSQRPVPNSNGFSPSRNSKPVPGSFSGMGTR